MPVPPLCRLHSLHPPTDSRAVALNVPRCPPQSGSIRRQRRSPPSKTIDPAQKLYEAGCSKVIDTFREAANEPHVGLPHNSFSPMRTGAEFEGNFALADRLDAFTQSPLRFFSKLILIEEDSPPACYSLQIFFASKFSAVSLRQANKVTVACNFCVPA